MILSHGVVYVGKIGALYLKVRQTSVRRFALDGETGAGGRGVTENSCGVGGTRLVMMWGWGVIV